jgi:hypothetical protein
MMKRDHNDRRSVKQVALDVHHDLGHRLQKKVEPHRPDAKMSWPHAGECEWTRANGDL